MEINTHSNRNRAASALIFVSRVRILDSTILVEGGIIIWLIDKRLSSSCFTSRTILLMFS
jgi:hypothetical protein